MARSSSKSVTAIQKLLAERAQIEGWLARLGLAGDKTPESVRDKVKADYQARLKELVEELRAYGDDLHDALKRQLQTRNGLSKQEKEAADRLAEAEVRHAVGEYDEAKWRDVHAEYLGTLVRLREELKTADEEIQRLDDAIKSLKPSPEESDEPPARRPAPAPAPPSTSSTFPPRGDKAPASTSSTFPPRGDKAPASTSSTFPPRGDKAPAKPLDELAFLKSVTDDDSKHGLKSSRASGQQSIPEHIKPPSGKDEKAPPPPPPPSKSGVDIGAAGVSQIDSSGPGKRLTAQLEKSLKCKECGTMNMPTEWYCEKCGAELSESL